MKISHLELNSSFKGYPSHCPPLPLAKVGDQGWQVLRGDLPLPLAVLKESALAHNLAWMRDFCVQHDVSIAPHGKTTMSPELYARQLAAGAWGISFATVFQAAVGLRHGVERVIIANQVVQDIDLVTLATLLAQTPSAQAWFLVDSLAQIAQIECWQRQHPSIVFDVLVEVGIAGKRTGARSHAQAMQLATAVAHSPALRLCGIECYEGALATCHSHEDRQAVQALLQSIEHIVVSCAEQKLFESQEIIVSAGGSSVFDLVAQTLPKLAHLPLRRLLRSGCYLAHDHIHYQRHLQCVAERLQLHQTLLPALEVLCLVQSCPEPGLALLNMGKRDVGYDLDLPIPLWRAGFGSKGCHGVPVHWQISALNDQHAYLRFDPGCPENEHPQVAEIIGCGISHPCTTFDKWRWMPIVDERYHVLEAITLHF
ncbi:MAG: amino acid deaminase [Gammaproteobacteria bacterium]|nr:amino acid deaminase [Gammaproteobacteria bacterium]